WAGGARPSPAARMAGRSSLRCEAPPGGGDGVSVHRWN
ncbi:MAG: hypothetical protein AVDCRST_MAG08-4163, partial [uncultured Acetobacteraceae bacterium]